MSFALAAVILGALSPITLFILYNAPPLASARLVLGHSMMLLTHVFAHCRRRDHGKSPALRLARKMSGSATAARAVLLVGWPAIFFSGRNSPGICGPSSARPVCRSISARRSAARQFLRSGMARASSISFSNLTNQNKPMNPPEFHQHRHPYSPDNSSLNRCRTQNNPIGLSGNLVQAPGTNRLRIAPESESALLRLASIFGLGRRWRFTGLSSARFSGGAQMWIAPAKLGLGTLLSVLICLPSLYIFTCLGGIDARLRSVCGALVRGGLSECAVLIGFAPVAWIFSQSTDSVAFMGALHLAFWVIGIRFGLRLIDAMGRFLGGAGAVI